MEVPPGRVERIADGGPEAFRSILAGLRAMKFNDVLKASVFRGDTASQGVLVLRRGDGVLAEHRSAVAVAGHEALPEILKDAASARAQLEVRTYDYGHSSISIDHLQRSYPEAAVEGIGDPDEVLEQAIAQEARERQAYEKELEGRRNQERSLVEREEELYRRKWELEQEYQRSGMRQRELDSLRTELQTVKQASGLIMSRLEERRASRDVEVESQKKVLAMESEKARAELEAQRRSLSERQAKLGGLERELASKEATYRGPRNVARFTSRIPRTGAEADERPLREPSGRGREDLRGPEGVRGPAPGGGTTRTAPHRPRGGHPGPRDEAPRPCGLRREARTGHGGTRKIAPATGGRARVARDGARREDHEGRQTGRSLRNSRYKPRRPT